MSRKIDPIAREKLLADQKDATERLIAIRLRRQTLEADLHRETATAIAQARALRISVETIAALLGVERKALYRHWPESTRKQTTTTGKT